MVSKRKVVLCILDGWGCTTGADDDAIYLADTPVFDSLLNNYPHSRLITSGGEVGLPYGQSGNSEVGHSVIGCGKVIDTDIVRINKLIDEDKLRDKVSKFASQVKGACHIAGLLSDGGVHAHYDHIEHLVKIVSQQHKQVYVHCFLDGRDTDPGSGVRFIKRLQDFIRNRGNVLIATISGRLYAMDRDKNWDRTKKAYEAIAWGRGEFFGNPKEHLEHCYARGITDEFLLPAVNVDYNGARHNDGLIMANFRADRARQIVSCLCDPKFSDFVTRMKVGHGLGMSEYSSDLNKIMSTILDPIQVGSTLGGVVSDAGLKQLRISETEKYAHVTYFFNGGMETCYKNEERIMIQSPRVASYDLVPEMASEEMTKKLCGAMKDFDFIVANYPGADMVGHTGNLPKTIKAVEAIDASLGRVVEEALKNNAVVIIAADHGNAERMSSADGGPFTAHTSGPTPFIVIGYGENIKLRNGSLADIAPTILSIMNLRIPADMTGKNLIEYLGD